MLVSWNHSTCFKLPKRFASVDDLISEFTGYSDLEPDQQASIKVTVVVNTEKAAAKLIAQKEATVARRAAAKALAAEQRKSKKAKISMEEEIFTPT